MAVELDETDLAWLIAHDDLRAVDVYAPELEAPDWGSACGLTSGDDGYTINGVEMMRLNQTKPFYDAGIYGFRLIAFTEGGADDFHTPHDAFKDGNGDPRAKVCEPQEVYPGEWRCDPTQFVGSNARSSESAHATAVAAILAQDLTQGQEACPAPSGEEACASNATLRAQKSGIARRAGLEGIDSPDWLNYLTDNDCEVLVLNKSAGNGLPPYTCLGSGAVAQTHNAVYEAGIGYVKSAGNDGHLGSSCRVNSSGGMGMFLVGDYTWGRLDEADTCTESVGKCCREGLSGCTIQQVDKGSSRGGYQDSRDRALLSLLAPEGFQFPITHASSPTWPVIYGGTELKRYRGDWTPANGQVGDPGGQGTPVTRGAYGAMTATSAATPQVAGVYALFHEWFYETIGSGIWLSPGEIYANLLLMGDRQREDGTHGTNGLDGLTGAGLLRARTFDATGLDGPAGYATGSVCVTASTTLTLPAYNGNPLPNGAEYVKVALWFYAPEFDDDDADPLEPITSTLQRDDGSGTWVDVVTTSTDNQRLLFTSTGVPGGKFRLRLTGGSITSDSTCGTDAVRVYLATLWEGNGREQGDTPECVRPEVF